MSAETKERRLTAEINNGRLASTFALASFDMQSSISNFKSQCLESSASLRPMLFRDQFRLWMASQFRTQETR